MDPFYREKFSRPERFLAEIIRQGSKDLYLRRDEHLPVFFRALVVAVDVEGGRLENPNGSGNFSLKIGGSSTSFAATVGPKNPANSVRARVISDGFDQFIHDDHLRTFWPLLPEHLMSPIKPGEYAYVFFEDPEYQHGLWLAKVSGLEGVNDAPGEKTLVMSDHGSLVNSFPDTNGLGASQTVQLNTNEAAAQVNSDNSLISKFSD